MGADLSDALQRAIVKSCDLSPTDVGPDTPLADLGIDSLAVAEIVVEMEIELDREFPVHLLRRLDGLGTVDDVAAELARALDEVDGERGASSSGST